MKNSEFKKVVSVITSVSLILLLCMEMTYFLIDI
jgi:hypothetical protein